MFPASKAADRRQAHLLREKAKLEQKRKREAKRDEPWIPPLLLTHEAILAALEESRKLPVKTLREISAEDQEEQAAMLGQISAWLIGFGWADDAGAFAANAFGKAGNAWRLRNPEPMMKEVHRFWLDSQGRK